MATKSTQKKKTPVKKAPAKKSEVKKTVSTKKAPVEKKVAEVTASESPKKMSIRSVKVKKTYAIGIVVILVIGALLYLGRSLFVAAVVNGQPISRLSVVQEAEKQSGRQILDTKVQQALIEQEAQAQHISVSDQEIADEIKKIEASLKKQGQSLDQVLQSQGMTRDALNTNIRLSKLVEKMVGKDIKISSEEIDDYLKQNKDFLPKNESEAQLRKTAEDSLKQQKLNEKAQTWLADLQKKANILYFVNY